MSSDNIEYLDEQGRTWRWRKYEFTQGESSLFAIAFDEHGHELERECIQVEPSTTEQTVEKLQEVAAKFDEQFPSRPQPIQVREFLTLQDFRRATDHLPGDVPVVIASLDDRWFNAALDPAGVPDTWPTEEQESIVLTAVDTYGRQAD